MRAVLRARPRREGRARRPAWLRDRLELVGIRSINNLVDLTNYVMMEMGQPSHAFDLGRVPGGAARRALVARRARRSTTLDGVERTLPARVGVIAGQGGEPALALAGIMGGASSEISRRRRASWRSRPPGGSPLAVRRAAQGARDAHRGLAPLRARRRRRRRAPGPSPASRTSSRRSAPARCGPGLVERKGQRRGPARMVRLRPARVSALLGVEVPRLQQMRTLESLGFVVSGSGARGRPSTCPSLAPRRLARGGPRGGGRPALRAATGSRPRCRRRAPGAGCGPRSGASGGSATILTGVGLTEVINYAFVAGAQMDAPPEGRARLANPLTEEQDTLRTSLVMPGLLDTLRTNLRLGRRDVAVFELGRVFAPARRARRARSGGWRSCSPGSTQPAPLVDEAAAVRPLRRQGRRRAALRAARRAAPEIDRETRAAPASCTPAGRCACGATAQAMGYAGALHPDVRAAWELKDEAVVLEIGLDGLLGGRAARWRASRALDRFPAVRAGPLDPLRRGDAGRGDRRAGARGGGAAACGR